MGAKKQGGVINPALQNASGVSQSFYCEVGTYVAMTIDISAVAGTSPTLNAEVQWSHDDVTYFSAVPTADTFPQFTGVGGAAAVFQIKAIYARLKWTLGGTGSPSFTFRSDYMLTGATV